MKLTKLLFSGLCLLLTATFTGCKDKDKDVNNPGNFNLGKNILGKWIQSTSDSINWMCLEFGDYARVNVEYSASGNFHSGSGYYWINEETDNIYGEYTNEQNLNGKFDWIVQKVNTFQIDIRVYDDDVYVNTSSLYKVLSDVSVGLGSDMTPNYKSLTGGANTSRYYSMNDKIAKVDGNTGEVTGVANGVTFVIFSTPAGYAAVQVRVDSNVQDLATMVVGSWVFDDVKNKTWERYVFDANGYAFVEWIEEGHDLNETGEGTWSVSGNNLTLSIKTSVGLNLSMVNTTISINNFEWTYNSMSGTVNNGTYKMQRILKTYTIGVSESVSPDYQTIVGDYQITGYASHNPSVAEVNNLNGLITGLTAGKTYIDVQTPNGAGVVEVIVEDNIIGYDFSALIDQSREFVEEMLGEVSFSLNDKNYMYYSNLTENIELVAVQLNDWTQRVRAVSVNFNDGVNVAGVTSLLGNQFYPYNSSQTSDTYKAFINAKDIKDATVGVTWDIANLSLIYVNLLQDPFTDYSVLLGMNRQEVRLKIGEEPYEEDDESQVYFFFEGPVQIVNVYFDLMGYSGGNADVVYVKLGPDMAESEILNYLNKKYIYYPEWDEDGELSFLNEDHSMSLFFNPETNWLSYWSLDFMGTRSLNQIKEKKKAVSLNKSFNY